MQDEAAARAKSSRTDLAEAVYLGACVALAFALIVRFAFPDTPEHITAFLPDDSFFYFQIAWNFPETHRFSYDTLHDTYGFQPLWQIALALLAYATPHREALLSWGLVVLGCLYAAVGLLLHGFLKASVGRAAGLMAATFWLANVPLLIWGIGGKENTLYALLLLLLLWHVKSRYLEPRVRAPLGLALGGLAGLLFLARVNSLGFLLLLAPVLLIALLERGGWPAWIRIRTVLLASLAFSAVVLPWLVYAHSSFGGVMPTSGIYKLRITRRLLEEQGVAWLSPAHLWSAVVSLPAYLVQLWAVYARPYAYWYGVCAVALGAFAILSRGERRPPGLGAVDRATWIALGLLCAWALGNSYANVLLLPSYVVYGTWYAVPELLVFAAGLGVLTEFALALFREPGIRRLLERRLPSRVTSAFGILLCAAVCLPSAVLNAHQTLETTRRWAERPGGNPMYRIARWARENVPEDVILGAFDSGVLTYFSGRTIVSLEALVSERALLDTPLTKYLEENDIEYVFGSGRRREDGLFESQHMPAGSYSVEWVPFPDRNFGWVGGYPTYILVRPDSATMPQRLHREAFSFGLWRPPTYRPPMESKPDPKHLDRRYFLPSQPSLQPAVPPP